MLARNKCDKKQKTHKRKDDLEKIQQEKRWMKPTNEDPNRKLLDILPDDIQKYIWGFVDTNTRLNFLRTIYTPDFVSNKLSQLSINRHTAKCLHSCIKYVKNTFNNYLNKDGEIYKNFIGYVGYNNTPDRYNMRFFTKSPSVYSNKRLIAIIIAGIKNYTRMYKQTKNAKDIQANETDILKLYARISSLK
jgi:oligoribonuclease NrnB/cAMP/cGMP phosphodiesterase (DHH superfamily)